MSGNVYVRLLPDTSHLNPGGCVTAYWLAVPHTQANVQQILQVLLTAQAAGLKVQLGINGCAGSYPNVQYVMTTS